METEGEYAAVLASYLFTYLSIKANSGTCTCLEMCNTRTVRFCVYLFISKQGTQIPLLAK